MLQYIQSSGRNDADLDHGGFLPIVTTKKFFWGFFHLIISPLKINGKIVFHSFKANKSTEREKLTHWGHRVHEKHARGFSSIFTAKVSLALRAPNPQLLFDPTIFNADFKPPAAALVEKSWGTNEHSFWLRITQHGRVYADIHPPAALVRRKFEKN